MIRNSKPHFLQIYLEKCAIILEEALSVESSRSVQQRAEPLTSLDAQAHDHPGPSQALWISSDEILFTIISLKKGR